MLLNVSVSAHLAAVAVGHFCTVWGTCGVARRKVGHTCHCARAALEAEYSGRRAAPTTAPPGGRWAPPVCAMVAQHSTGH
jgi:hypothetical protein